MRRNSKAILLDAFPIHPSDSFFPNIFDSLSNLLLCVLYSLFADTKKKNAKDKKGKKGAKDKKGQSNITSHTVAAVFC